MSVLIVAITHGRSKKEWYSWITNRVKKNYGYETASSLRQLYAESRLVEFRARREERASQEKSAGKRSASSSSAQTRSNSTEVQLTGHDKESLGTLLDLLPRSLQFFRRSRQWWKAQTTH